jgi:hypothetical protein
MQQIMIRRFTTCTRASSSYTTITFPRTHYTKVLCDLKASQAKFGAFPHILNLVVVDILEDLGSSNNKHATEFLDRATKAKWKEITLPGAQGVIAILRITVLWIHRSAGRKLEGDSRPNTRRRIPTDVDNRWNYTVRMIEATEEHKAAIDDTINDHSELEPLRLTTSHWKKLAEIKTVLKPFERYSL